MGNGKFGFIHLIKISYIFFKYPFISIWLMFYLFKIYIYILYIYIYIYRYIRNIISCFLFNWGILNHLFEFLFQLLKVLYKDQLTKVPWMFHHRTKQKLWAKHHQGNPVSRLPMVLCQVWWSLPHVNRKPRWILLNQATEIAMFRQSLLTLLLSEILMTSLEVLSIWTNL